MADALATAHAGRDALQPRAHLAHLGIVHRDLKPANVLLGPFGDAVVIDWGLAGAARVWDAATGRALSVLRGHERGVFWLQLRPDGRQLATAGVDPVPRLWSLPREDASPAELAERARCVGAWTLEAGMPVPPSAGGAGPCARP